MSRRKRFLVQMLTFVLVFGGVVSFAYAGSGESDTDISLGRIQGEPLPTPTPTPAPTPEPAPEPVSGGGGPPECEQLNNPGGGLDWTRSHDAGPWPTDGRIGLSSLGVDAPIVRVGVGPSGEMVVPSAAHQVAWLDQGEFPGRTNNAVLAGHISWGGQAGAFSRIQQLRDGAPVVVTMDGQRWEFRVTWVCAFDRNTHLAEQIMGQTEVPSVTLITCGGVFDRSAGTHTQRIAARAELVSVTDTA